MITQLDHTEKTLQFFARIVYWFETAKLDLLHLEKDLIELEVKENFA